MNEQTSKEIVELKSINAEKAIQIEKQIAQEKLIKKFGNWEEIQDCEIEGGGFEKIWVGKIFMNKKEYCVYAPIRWLDDGGFLRESYEEIVLADAVSQIYKLEGITRAKADVRICSQSEDKRSTECEANVRWNRCRQHEQRHFVFIQ